MLKKENMKTTIYHLLRTVFTTLLAVFALTACYDDDKLWDAINDQDLRIQALENWQKVTNSNIEALKVLVSGQDYITAIAPIIENGETVGYAITFNLYGTVNLYNGLPGTQGSQGEQGEQGPQGSQGDTPVISVTRHTDGNWYWTLNGELLTDASGNPIRANALDGQDGTPGTPGEPGTPGTPGQPGKPGSNGSDAILPQLKTGEQLEKDQVPVSAGNGYAWTTDAIYLSVDNGSTWTQVSGNPGQNGEKFTIFSSVDIEKYYLRMTLHDGTTIQIPRYNPAALIFTLPLNGSDEVIYPKDEILLLASDKAVIKYSPTGAADSGTLLVSTDISSTEPGWKAEVDLHARAIKITLPSKAKEKETATLWVTATNNAGITLHYRFILKEFAFRGEGTSASPYLLSTSRELRYLAATVDDGNDYEGVYFRLENDIDLESKNWIPMGRKKGIFKGNFDGNGHSISGLKVNTKDYAGFFGYVSGSTLENLTLLSPEVKADTTCCGALVGWCEKAKIKDCYVRGGSCIANAIIGGMIGFADNILISNCHVKEMTLTATDEHVGGYWERKQIGGLIGAIRPDYDSVLEIKNCSASGCTITAYMMDCGGLIGAFYPNQSKLKIIACYTTGTVIGPTIVHRVDTIKPGALLGSALGDHPKVEMIGCYTSCELRYLDNKLYSTPTMAGFINNDGEGETPGGTYKASYYITSQNTPNPLPAGLTYLKPEVDIATIVAAMNTATGNAYNDDGSLATEVWK